MCAQRQRQRQDGNTMNEIERAEKPAEYQEMVDHQGKFEDRGDMDPNFWEVSKSLTWK